MKCPTCGGPVKVEGGTTKYYRPVLSPEVERLVKAAKIQRKDLDRFGAVTLRHERALVKAVVAVEAALAPFEEKP